MIPSDEIRRLDRADAAFRRTLKAAPFVLGGLCVGIVAGNALVQLVAFGVALVGFLVAWTGWASWSGWWER